jgi:hypothetical protein
MVLAALDPASEVDEVTMNSGMEELKRRLEVLIGAKPEAGLDVSEKDRLEAEVKETMARRDRMSTAGGQLLASAFGFLSQLVPQSADADALRTTTERMKAQLAECLDKDDQGQLRMTITLPDSSALGAMAESLARLVEFAGGPR